jgi:hypothetical protein
MMIGNKPSHCQWRCAVCGQISVKPYGGDRPSPGKCLRSRDKKSPHKWVIEKKW